jgi:DNA-binding PadR family transcriptional regulator
MDGPHGLAIKHELAEYYESDINHGRLYPNLDELVEKGLLEKGETDGRTNVYRLSQRGPRKLHARSDWKRQYIEDKQPATM